MWLLYAPYSNDDQAPKSSMTRSEELSALHDGTKGQYLYDVCRGGVGGTPKADEVR